MTRNKRYVRIVDHTEKEVRIFDENTGKKLFNIFFHELDSAVCLNGALGDTVDLLNSLSEENELLKQSNEIFLEMFDNVAKYMKRENKYVPIDKINKCQNCHHYNSLIHWEEGLFHQCMMGNVLWEKCNDYDPIEMELEE